MTRMNVARAAAIVAVVIAAGCGGGSQGPASESGQAVDITFKTDPDPVRVGENIFEVMVMQDGQPVMDAMVTTEFFMAAMPSMNMPEMRTQADLTHAGNGMYRGTGQVMMAGDWEVTVMAMRNAQEIGSRTVTVSAK